MGEIIARINNGTVELIDEKMIRVSGLEPFTPNDAAYLARGLLCCAEVSLAPNAPTNATIIGDAHLPIMRWRTGTSTLTGEPVLILTVPSGIELTFVIPPIGAVALGEALMLQGQGSAPPSGPERDDSLK